MIPALWLLVGCPAWYSESLEGTGRPISFASVAGGGDATGACGIDEGGTAWCWGQEPLGTLQLRDTCADVTCSRRPVAVWDEFGDNDEFTRIESGGGSRCAINEDGALWCWGRNSASQLGIPDRDVEVLNPDELVPREVSLPEGEVFVDIAMGPEFTCALADSGELYCWGLKSSVTLGPDEIDEQASCTNFTSSTDCILTPRLRPGASRYVDIAATAASVCGIAEGGGLECIGAGVIGTDITGRLCDSSSGRARVCTYEPLPLVPSESFVAVDGGTSQICALSASGAAWCFDEFHVDPQPYRVDSPPLREVHVGSEYALGLAEDGSVVSSFGTWETWYPHEVPGPVLGLAAGGPTACVLVEGGRIGCFGDGSYGGFGDGSDQGYSLEPVWVGEPYKD